MTDFKTIPFRPEHIDQLDMTPRQLGAMAFATPQTWVCVAEFPAITVIADGKVLACGGEIPMWAGRARFWAMFTKSIGSRMTACTRAARLLMENSTASRLEMDVGLDHEEGHRFARLLGFHVETPRMPGYFPDGTDAAMYVRFKGELA